MRDAELANDVLKYQRAKAELKARTEDARVERIRQEMLKKQQEGLEEARRVKKEKEDNALSQQMMFRKQA